MVHVGLSIVATPERKAAFVNALRSLMLAVQAAPGFIRCRLFLDADNPNGLYYIEDWDRTEDLDRQIRSSHYTRLLALMEEAAEPPDLQLSWPTNVRGLDYLEAVRTQSMGEASA